MTISKRRGAVEPPVYPEFRQVTIHPLPSPFPPTTPPPLFLSLHLFFPINNTPIFSLLTFTYHLLQNSSANMSEAV